MHYIGFDVSKNTADYALLTRTLRVQEQSSMPNETEQIMDLLQPLQEKKKSIIVGVESTAMYHLPVVEACSALNIPCKLLNPVLTKECLRRSIRKRKTDREDAVIIAKLIAQDEGQYVYIDDLRCHLKTLVRSARKVGSLARSLDLHTRHVERIGTVPFGLWEQHEHLTELQKNLQQEAIDEAPIAQRRLLESIPGIGSWTAAVILAEVGDITRFSSGDALIATAGLDPRVRISGSSLRSTGRLTKRGSPHLRCALFVATNVARRWDPELRVYYEKKRNEGKSYTVAVCATARKLIYRIYAVMKRGTPYVRR